MKVANVAPKHMLGPECGGRLRELGAKVFAMPGGDTQIVSPLSPMREITFRSSSKMVDYLLGLVEDSHT